jgi:hypothetical protein
MAKLSVLFAFLFALLASSNADAQSWSATPNVFPLSAADTAQLPLSATFQWLAPAGWTVEYGSTWNAIWPRNASGAWYRMNTYSQPGIRKNPVYSYPYNCVVSGAGFKCRDQVRGIDRFITCPATIAIGPMRLWRSEYNFAWLEKGLFTWDRGPFSATTGRTLPFCTASVTAAGKQINCQYGNSTPTGPGTTTDIWVHRR